MLKREIAGLGAWLRSRLRRYVRPHGLLHALRRRGRLAGLGGYGAGLASSRSVGRVADASRCGCRRPWPCWSGHQRRRAALRSRGGNGPADRQAPRGRFPQCRRGRRHRQAGREDAAVLAGGCQRVGVACKRGQPRHEGERVVEHVGWWWDVRRPAPRREGLRQPGDFHRQFRRLSQARPRAQRRRKDPPLGAPPEITREICVDGRPRGLGPWRCSRRLPTLWGAGFGCRTFRLRACQLASKRPPQPRHRLPFATASPRPSRSRRRRAPGSRSPPGR